jgi:hypothetical protein
MKNKLGFTALFAAVIGFTGGLIGANLISPAYANTDAARNTVIRLESQEEMMQQCNFDKTITDGNTGTYIYCVKK